MLRVFLFSMLASACIFAQANPPQTQPKTPAPQIPQQPFHPENISPDTVLIDVQGICSGLGDGTVKQSPCSTQITKTQFDAMLAAAAPTNTMSTSAAQRGFAESYVQLLALADAAEKSGIDKDPQFLELMKIVRVRTMGEAYKHYLENKANNPTQEELEAYYKQNSAKFETIRIERVIVPPAIGRRGTNTAADATKKARELADKIHERAVKGEDMTVLQADVYKTMGLPAPPNTDMGTRRHGTLSPALEADLFALKPGEVTKVEIEPAGFTIYRLRTHDFPALETVRAELLHDMQQQYVVGVIKSAQEKVHTSLNQDYFVPYSANRGPITRQTHQIQPGPVAPAGATPSAVTVPKP